MTAKEVKDIANSLIERAKAKNGIKELTGEETVLLPDALKQTYPDLTEAESALIARIYNSEVEKAKERNECAQAGKKFSEEVTFEEVQAAKERKSKDQTKGKNELEK